VKPGGNISKPHTSDAILGGNNSHLDDMLSRLQRLREERKQILIDMNLMRSAFQETQGDDVVEERQSSLQEDVSPRLLREDSRGRSHAESLTETLESVTCFICGTRLNSGLTSSALMHMGLADGEPTCPRSIDLSEKARNKIKSVAATAKLNPKAKYELLQVLAKTLIGRPAEAAAEKAGTAPSFSDSLPSPSASGVPGSCSLMPLNSNGGVTCFICGAHVGRRLTTGAMMHMGICDGEPICPRAMDLPEKARGKIRSIASTRNLDPQAKYDLLHTLDLASAVVRAPEENADTILRAQRFLEAVERREESNLTAIASNAKKDEALRPNGFVTKRRNEESAAQKCQTNEDKIAPLTVDVSEQKQSVSRELHQQLLREISSGSVRLSHSPGSPVDDEDHAGGKVLHLHVAPEVDLLDAGRRSLMRQISNEDKK
jgi:hypothetical protein